MNHTLESQEAVFALLADPATHGGAKVKRIDTHAATVFLAGARAFKVKRAVRFPFLDYSSLDKRKAACEAEIEVNRPFAPDIYRRVVAITREPDGRLALDGGGAPVEWAVEMRRFAEDATLDRLADNGKIDAALADALGRAVAAAHAGAAPVAPEPWIKAIADYIEEHVAAFGETPELFPSGEIDALARMSRAGYGRIHPLLVERGRRGLIRRIHGDLHLGNIVLLEGRPVLFDAIEFSPLIASGDVLYDLAFLLMDLTERGLGAAANIVLNRYLVETRRPEDLDALAALPFFLSMRAAIRAKVTAARLAQADTKDKAAIGNSARKYFESARRFIAPAPPVLVAVGGLSGTGKSVLARALAPALGAAPGAVLLRSDVERKLLFGKDEHDKLPDAAYAPEVTARVYAAIVDKARRAVAAGHAAIVDAVFAQPHERRLAEQCAATVGVAFHGLFLDADLATRLARIGARSRDASDADAAVARQQDSYDLGELDWGRIDASGTPEQTLARVRAALRAASHPRRESR
ncbi:MAG: AAA family ATPase [Xanthobacteraceae bacterium]|jgi:aminoglycoside phosphotransferase family enzyme/predicted kinase